MISASLVCDGRCVVGTVVQDPATGLFEGVAFAHIGAPVIQGLLGTSQDCGRHQTKVTAVEAVLRASGVFSVWDM
jgi:hypothetical protein